jgi:hypothetical protein
MIDLEIIAVTYKQGFLLRAFVDSILAQTNENWKLHLVHDGPWEMKEATFYSMLDERITISSSPMRYADWGHSLRARTIPNLDNSRYTLITNGDNYYTPVFIREMTKYEEDLIYCDFIHSHQEYRRMFETHLVISQIDCGALIVKTDIVKRIGWNYRNFAADWEFVREVMELNPTTRKVEKTLFVHN